MPDPTPSPFDALAERVSRLEELAERLERAVMPLRPQLRSVR